MIKCKGCDEDKTLSDFYLDRGKPKKKCKVCVKTARNERYASNPLPQIELSRSYRDKNKDELRQKRKDTYDPNKQRARVIKNLYNISLEDYDKLLVFQNYRCGVCKRHVDELPGVLQVDHDHACCPGKKSCGNCIRGLLCNSCNGGLGLFNDDADRLFAALTYLQENNCMIELINGWTQ